MKVICISKETPAHNHPDLVKAANELIVGEIYTVIDEWNNLYELEEFPHPRRIYWEKRNFIPLSNIDETEMKREYNQVTNPFL